MIFIILALATIITIGIDSKWNFEFNSKVINCNREGKCIDSIGEAYEKR